jgi:hypothetical protein
VGRFTPFEQHERGALRSDDVARVGHQPPQASLVSGQQRRHQLIAELVDELSPSSSPFRWFSPLF